MTPVCPFVKAARPDDASVKKPGESQSKQHGGSEKPKQESGEPAMVPSKCPFVHKQQAGSEIKPNQESGEQAKVSSKCPFGYTQEAGGENKPKQVSEKPGVMSPKCPLGFDSQTFKLGPLSCMICQALLYDCSRCVPCSHVFCKVCITRFKDCPLCGADVEKIEADENLQSTVDRFIEGHARIKRPQVNADQEDVGENKTVIYEDVSLERGSFLVHHAMRAFRANNVESAKSRLSICAEDIREQVERMGNTSELCSQLGAVLGMLGDCCRATGDAASAVKYFEESVNFLLKVPKDDLEITHTLSVSLNKIGDLKYYDEDLQAARSYYFQALDIRRNAIKQHSQPSQTIDVAVSLAKVADVDRNIGNEKTAVDGFQEAIEMLQCLKLNPEEVGLEQRRLSVLEFLNSQLGKKETNSGS
ncbi:PREDICTED: uncharacterized protein LOC109182055 [Ipomoea nil]|uniref:uncharacterized protein LOC109182055 n=1 Tax=Ipomoea nil TaxID=35883 RepID=UPI000901BA88|nr:PREDICTED: uncharacterized protein LOC109182055 [Ipomoea nil]